MTIDDNDLYYGAALKQIADDKRFKSINAEWQDGGKSRCAYRINTDIGIYVRLATKPINGEYVFNFRSENIQQIKALEKVCKKVFVVLVCYNAKAINKGTRGTHHRQICVLSTSAVDALVEAREQVNALLPQHNILIKCPPNKSMRAAVTIPGKKNDRINLVRAIPRNAFPQVIFE